MLVYSEKGYSFYLKSQGVVVLKGDEYLDFFYSLVEAFDAVFND